jgi:hypothetical protein
MSSFKFDADALKSAVLGLAEDHVRGQAAELQRLADGLSATHQGRPLKDVKTTLTDQWRRVTDGGEIAEPELTSGQPPSARAGRSTSATAASSRTLDSRPTRCAVCGSPPGRKRARSEPAAH